MVQTTVRPHEVNLDSIRYRLKGPMRITLPEGFAQKTILGDFTQEGLRRRNTIRWSDFSGGVGLEKVSPQDAEINLRKVWWTDAWLWQPGHVIVGPKVTTGISEPSENGNDDDAVLVEFNGQIYAAGSNDDSVEHTNTTDDSASFTDTNHNLGNQAQDAVSGRIGGTDYIIWGVDGSGYEFSTDGDNYTVGGREAHLLVIWDDRLWGLDIDDNQLWFTLVPSATAGDHTNDAIVPVEVGRVLDMFVGPDAAGENIIYVLTRDALYAHDAANSRFIKTAFQLFNPIKKDATEQFINYRIRCAVWRGSIYIPIGLDVWEYSPSSSPATIRNIGPGSTVVSPGDVVVRGPIQVVAPAATFLAIMTNPAASGATTAGLSRFLWNGASWANLSSPSTGATPPTTVVARNLIVTSHTQTTKSIYKIWYAIAGQINFFILPADITNPRDDPEWIFDDTAGAELITPWLDVGTDSDSIALRVKIDADRMNANNTIALSYRLNFADQDVGTGFTSLGSAITTDGLTEFTFPDNGTSIEGLAFRFIQFKITFVSSGTTASPDLLSLEFEWFRKPTAKLAFEFDIDMKKPYADRTPLDQFFALQNSIVNSTVLLELTWKDTSKTQSSLTRTYYVGVTGLQMVEEGTGSSDGGVVRVFAEEI